MNDQAFVKAQSEEYRATVSAGQKAIKACFLVNGGGAIALLAFMGNFSGDSTIIKDLSLCLVLFGIGTALVAISAIFAYLSNYHFFQHTRDRGMLFRNISLCGAFAALLFFLGSLIRLYFVF